MGNESMVKELISAGADLHAIEVDLGFNALHEAAFSGHIETVLLLLSKGAAARTVDTHGSNPLHLVAARGFEAVVQALLDAEAEMMANPGAPTAMHAAAMLKHAAAVRRRGSQVGNG
jgi:ankyrin repeat protein